MNDWQTVRKPGYVGGAPSFDKKVVESVTRLKAVILDVDGTLYDPRPMRRALLRRLFVEYCGRPAAGIRTLRILRTYRQAMEMLRVTNTQSDLAAAQVSMTAKRLNVPAELVQTTVRRWMENEPLPLLSRCLRAGLAEFLSTARKEGLQLAIVSDYPVAAKLRAMRLESFFSVGMCTTDGDVQALTPSPKVIDLARQRLGVERHETMYIGDRVDVDLVAATRAGVMAAIVGAPTFRVDDQHLFVPDYRILAQLLQSRGNN
jgi:FMN phosphatase YigB (HAD superfamily)